MLFGNRKKYLRRSRQFSHERRGALLSWFSIVTIFKNITPHRNLKFDNLGFFYSLKLRNLMRKILRISLKLNFTSNTLGCYGLRKHVLRIKHHFRTKSLVRRYAWLKYDIRLADFISVVFRLVRLGKLSVKDI